MLVDVAVALILKDGQVLAVYNENWGAFTLPMAKRRVWKDEEEDSLVGERWEDAAGRAASEVLGRTVLLRKLTLPEDRLHGRSWRDGRVKAYRYQTFLVLRSAPEPRDGILCEWLSPGDLLDNQRHPISETAFVIVECLSQQHPELFGETAG